MSTNTNTIWKLPYPPPTQKAKSVATLAATLPLSSSSSLTSIPDQSQNPQIRVIEELLRQHGAAATVQEVQRGPTLTRFGLSPNPHTKTSKIAALANDLALALAVPAVRIELPIPGKSLIGIEVPNAERQTVTLESLMTSLDLDLDLELAVEVNSTPPTPSSNVGVGVGVGVDVLKFALGRDVAGQPVITDLTMMPHLLIAGATGAGKSVFINALIVNLLRWYTPDHVQFVMIDPKMVELTPYNGIPHLRFGVVTDIAGPAYVQVGHSAAPAPEMLFEDDTETETGDENGNTLELKWNTNSALGVLAALGKRDIAAYNQSIKNLNLATDGNGSGSFSDFSAPSTLPLPYLVIIIDELADLMMVAPSEVETTIARLAQKARAVGIHLVVATQRPSAEIVTGLIKSNLPTRISFAVASQIDSRVILDTQGAEKLLGRGDMLYVAQGTKPQRVQGVFVSDEEIAQVVHDWRVQALAVPAAPAPTPTPLTPTGVFQLQSQSQPQSQPQSGNNGRTGTGTHRAGGDGGSRNRIVVMAAAVAQPPVEVVVLPSLQSQSLPTKPLAVNINTEPAPVPVTTPTPLTPQPQPQQPTQVTELADETVPVVPVSVTGAVVATTIEQQQAARIRQLETELAALTLQLEQLQIRLNQLQSQASPSPQSVPVAPSVVRIDQARTFVEKLITSKSNHKAGLTMSTTSSGAGTFTQRIVDAPTPTPNNEHEPMAKAVPVVPTTTTSARVRFR